MTEPGRARQVNGKPGCVRRESTLASSRDAGSINSRSSDEGYPKLRNGMTQWITAVGLPHRQLALDLFQHMIRDA